MDEYKTTSRESRLHSRRSPPEPGLHRDGKIPEGDRFQKLESKGSGEREMITLVQDQKNEVKQIKEDIQKPNQGQKEAQTNISKEKQSIRLGKNVDKINQSGTNRIQKMSSNGPIGKSPEKQLQNINQSKKLSPPPKIIITGPKEQPKQQRPGTGQIMRNSGRAGQIVPNTGRKPF